MQIHTYSKRIRTNDESDVCVCLLVVSKSFPTCFDGWKTMEKEREREQKKRAEHKQNLLIYFVCKAFDSRDLLSVKAETDWELRTFAEKLSSNGE